MSIISGFIESGTGFIISDTKLSLYGEDIGKEEKKCYEFTTNENQKIIAGFTYNQKGIQDVVNEFESIINGMTDFTVGSLYEELNKNMTTVEDCCWYSLMITPVGDIFKIYCEGDGCVKGNNGNKGKITVEVIEAYGFIGAVNNMDGFDNYLTENIISNISNDDKEFNQTKNKYLESIKANCNTETCGGTIHVDMIILNNPTNK